MFLQEIAGKNLLRLGHFAFDATPEGVSALEFSRLKQRNRLGID
jgi:hypothetical protein